MKFVKKVLLVLLCVLSLVGCGYQEMQGDQITACKEIEAAFTSNQFPRLNRFVL